MLFRVSFWNDRADTEVFGKTIEAENECEAEGIFFDELEEENDYSDEYPVLVQEIEEEPFMKLEKEEIIKGYAAFDKETGKGLNNYWSGGSQTGTNRQSLTEDIDKVSIADDKATIEMLIDWFNETHKKQVNFEIKKVKLVTKTSLIKED